MRKDDAHVYRERERNWRTEAAKTLPGPEKIACEALADGYARLIALINEPDIAEGRSMQTVEL